MVAGLVMACGDGDTSSNTRLDIAETFESNAEAYLNGEVAELATYLSEECTEENANVIARAALIAGNIIDGEVDVSIDAPNLVIEELGDGRVLVPTDQPEGVVELLVDGRPLSNDGIGESVWVLEDGFWRFACEDAAGRSGGETQPTAKENE